MEFYSAHSDEIIGDHEDIHFDDERPPTYNAEDYALHLKKYSTLTDQYSSSKNTKYQNQRVKRSASKKNYSHFCDFDGFTYEMGLRQFRTVSQLLNKLKIDLHLSYNSFVREFISDPNDGVTLLLDLLKQIQLSQTSQGGVSDQRTNPSTLKRALSDEYEALLCLKLCSEMEDGALKISEHSSGLFTVSVCVMSNFSKSRVLALQLLTRMCHIPKGHTMVADAISMLRLKFGEPVRFKFLIGMLNSFNTPAFQIACLRFLNTFVQTATTAKEQVQVQCEMEEAGLDILQLKRNIKNGASNNLLTEELDIWCKAYIDVNDLVVQNTLLRKEVDTYLLQLKALKEKCAGMERQGHGNNQGQGRLNPILEAKQKNNVVNDCQRWVEGLSDQESTEESVEDGEVVKNKTRIIRNNNKVIISCNNDHQTTCILPKHQKEKENMQKSTSESSYSEKGEKEESKEGKSKNEKKGEQRVTKISIRNQDHEYFPDRNKMKSLQYNDRSRLVSKVVHQNPNKENEVLLAQLTEKLKETPNKEKQTALSRCKSFLGLKTDKTKLEARNTYRNRAKSIERSFVLKSTEENRKQRQRIKRSKSMDISKLNFLQNSPKNGVLSLNQMNSYPYRNKFEYVKKWQKDSQIYDNNSQNPTHSFYSLYFPQENISSYKPLPEDSVDSVETDSE